MRFFFSATTPLPATLLTLLTTAALITLLGSCNKPASGAPPQLPPTPVGVASPISQTLAATREMTGHIEAIHYVELRPRVGGIITEVLVADGAEVQAGEVLFKIDEAPLKANLARAEADVARTKIRATLTGKILVRLKKLLDGEIITQQNYDDAVSAVDTANAEQSATAAALIKAQLDLGYATITAPIAGRIGKIAANTGNIAQESGPATGTLLTTLVSVNPVYVAFDLDEGTWRSLGARLRASADAHGQGPAAVPVQVGLPGETGYPHAGTVTFVDNHIDGGSGSIRIRAQVPNADQALTPGAFARIQLQVAPPRPVLLVNERAIQAQLTTRYVFVVDDQGITAFRPVQLGESIGAMRVITSGLAGTERIAVNNLAKIFFPGMAVSPLPASMETTENTRTPLTLAPTGPKPTGAAPTGSAVSSEKPEEE